ncbi:hypothetical protein KUH03_07615 [Sphingobacterium sp. E70]|uniref:hypothetical protein n=1 Tax=Sphingobacterium sp. E70 TaxID=2853439 RepID=UPI00211CB670|nr:hypothetical protein [Sphingobacterium sp. E70]ULT26693.1 hypothetical protein KUH03_07615 [Sphingobacterium sp. E70]
MQGFNSQLDSIRTSYLAAFPQSLAVLDWYRPYLAVMNYNQLEELHAKLDKRLEQYSTYQELLKSRQEKRVNTSLASKHQQLLQKLVRERHLNLNS